VGAIATMVAKFDVVVERAAPPSSGDKPGAPPPESKAG